MKCILLLSNYSNALFHDLSMDFEFGLCDNDSHVSFSVTLLITHLVKMSNNTEITIQLFGAIGKKYMTFYWEQLVNDVTVINFIDVLY